MIRVVFNKADAIKIGEYREHLNYALQKFEVRAHVKFEPRLFLSDDNFYVASIPEDCKWGPFETYTALGRK